MRYIINQIVEAIEAEIHEAWTESDADFNRGMEYAVSIVRALDIRTDSDTISRQDAINAIEHWGRSRGSLTNNQIVELQREIESLPSAEPKTGEWVKVIDEETSNVTKWHYECDQCRTGRYENGQRYCHNCGAKMLREDGEEE